MGRNTLFCLALSALLSACSGGTEDHVLSAIKEYRLNNVSIEDAFQTRIAALKEEGRTVQYEWTLNKLSETEYAFTTLLAGSAVRGKRPIRESYEWMATKNVVKSKGLRSEIWNLKAASPLARKIIRGMSNPRMVAKLTRRRGR